MIKKCCQFLLGLNGASIIRGLRLGPGELVRSSLGSFARVHPMQAGDVSQNQKDLEAIPQVTLDDILGDSKVSIVLPVQKYEDGMMPSHEVMVLLSILVTVKPAEVLEIGTFMGHTTRAMAENVRDTVIHTVDLPPAFDAKQDLEGGPPKDDFHLIGRRSVGREFKGREVAEHIRQHFGDTATMDFRELGKPLFFFIDGSHTYEYCKQDSEKCYQLSNGKGIFLWHDCDNSHPGVIRFVLEWRAMGRNVVLIRGTAIAYWNASDNPSLVARSC